MPNKPVANTPDEGAHEIDTTRYRVLSGGITAPSGRPVATFWKGDIVTGEELGGADRVAKLLSRKAIEVVSD